jgi:uncharacterized protein YqgC (DUF456 family)
MDWALYLVTLCVMVIGLWLNVLTLPGIWLMVGSVGVYALMTKGQYVGIPGILVLTGIGLVAEFVEFAAGGAGAKKAGGSKRAFAGSIVGGILGAIFLSVLVPIPIIGTIIGICAGTFVGAAVVEFFVKSDADQAFRVGVGATKGRLIGIFVKLLFGVVIFFVAAFIAMPPLTKKTVTVPTTTTTTTTLPTTMPATTQALEQ